MSFWLCTAILGDYARIMGVGTDVGLSDSAGRQNSLPLPGDLAPLIFQLLQLLLAFLLLNHLASLQKLPQLLIVDRLHSDLRSRLLPTILTAIDATPHILQLQFLALLPTVLLLVVGLRQYILQTLQIPRVVLDRLEQLVIGIDHIFDQLAVILFLDDRVREDLFGAGSPVWVHLQQRVYYCGELVRVH